MGHIKCFLDMAYIAQSHGIQQLLCLYYNMALLTFAALPLRTACDARSASTLATGPTSAATPASTSTGTPGLRCAWSHHQTFSLNALFNSKLLVQLILENYTV